MKLSGVGPDPELMREMMKEQMLNPLKNALEDMTTDFTLKRNSSLKKTIAGALVLGVGSAAVVYDMHYSDSGISAVGASGLVGAYGGMITTVYNGLSTYLYSSLLNSHKKK